MVLCLDEFRTTMQARNAVCPGNTILSTPPLNTPSDTPSQLSTPPFLVGLVVLVVVIFVLVVVVVVVVVFLP